MAWFVYDQTQFFIYNPLLNQHKYKTLPRPNNVPACPGYNKVIGFGYDSVINDYKVVFWYNEGDYKPLAKAQVYTLGMNCWRKVETPDEYITVNMYYGISPVFLNGVIHWLGYYGSSKEWNIGEQEQLVVISFNVSNEVFQWFPLPEPDFVNLKDAQINVYRNMLCAVNSVKRMDKRYYDIWVMSKYGDQESWIKQLVLEQEVSQPGNCMNLRSLRGIMMNGEFVWDNHIYEGQYQNYRGRSLAVDYNGISKPIFKCLFILELCCTNYTQSLVSISPPRNDERVFPVDWRSSLFSVFISRLSRKVSRKSLWSAFSEYGKVADVFIQHPNRLKGHDTTKTYAFVRFWKEKEAKLALEKADYRFLEGNLPDDITKEILLRFPVKSILRFRLITHDPFEVYLDIELPFTSSSWGYFRIVGSYNGLVCFYDETQFFIYNPLLNQHKTLPRPNDVDSAWYRIHEMIGFGYDSVSNDYKVVFWCNDEGPHGKKQLAEVYSLGMNCWRKVETPDEDIAVDEYGYHKSPAFLNGVIHWLGHSGRSLKVIRFNVNKEVFQLIPLPNYVVKDARTVEINVFRDMLCVVNSVTGTDNWNYDIWVMTSVQESWTKQLVVEQELPLRGNYYVRDLRGIMMNGELFWESHIYNSEYRGGLAVDNGKPNSNPILFDDSLYLKFSTYTESSLLDLVPLVKSLIRFMIYPLPYLLFMQGMDMYWLCYTLFIFKIFLLVLLL
ncbi:hypothetical protein COLO4_12912 [Corchorus olitorius]|uniref:RRM domain-containing protein n=1 Tax=Corchorus olitorius TaxID=93759 RepID=A0A1R3JZ51_9ROSI|nr:hypothetical protein COLO4_12912 [Corchorus olitorius]